MTLGTATLAPGLIGLWLGARDRPTAWQVHRGIGLFVTVVVIVWFWVRHGDASPSVQRTERVVGPVVSALLLAIWLPWSPTIAAVTSSILLLLVMVLLLQSLRRADGIENAGSVGHLLVHAARGVATTALFVSGLAAAAEWTRQDAPDVTRASIGCLESDIGPDVPPNVAAALLQSLSREGDEAGCMVNHVFVSLRGVHGVLTSGGYVVLGWEHPSVAGWDGEPHAAVWWSDALYGGASELLDSYVPSDRLQCENGAAVLFLDDAGMVRAVAASADYEAWFLVPGELIGAFVEKAIADGRLPMPVGPPESSSGNYTQPVNVAQVLRGDVPARLVAAEVLEALCDGGA